MSKIGVSKKKSITLSDVAQQVGLAKSTVAFVMSGKAADVGLAQKTIEKVEAAAKKLGYVPNYWAGSLARQSSDIISVLFPGLSGDWGDRIMFSISQTLTAKSYFPFLVADWHDPILFEKGVSAAIQRRDAGVICHSCLRDAEQYARIIENGIPLVFLGDVPLSISNPNEVNAVIWNDETPVKTAVEHLLNTGRRKIAFIGADHGIASDQRRLVAYEEALEEAGLEVRQEWQGWLKIDSFSFALTREILESMFAPGKEGPAALFAINDAVALDVLRVLTSMDISVPEDVAIITIGTSPAGQQAGLSTMREPIHELGEAAARMILELIEDPDKKPLHQKISCNELLIRKTTAV